MDKWPPRQKTCAWVHLPRTRPGPAGAGFGCRLLEHLLERAAASGVNEAFLEVRPSNLAAIRLYQRLGFEQIGIRRGYHQAPDGREDAIVLKLELRQA